MLRVANATILSQFTQVADKVRALVVALLITALCCILSPRSNGQTFVDDAPRQHDRFASPIENQELSLRENAGLNIPQNPFRSEAEFDEPEIEIPSQEFFGSTALPYDGEEYDQWKWSHKSLWPPTYCLHVMYGLGLRHSQTHGRHVGLGAPFVSTSWLNRPYYVGAEVGELWIMRSEAPHVSRDSDIFGGIFVGWDWDHFWGSELRIDWATPELVNSEAPDADRTDSLFAWSANLMYYPWGDSKFRPFWRWGVGTTQFDFPNDEGVRREETLLTLPIGIGIKYPIRPWLTARGEFTDQFSVGNDGLPPQHNLTLTLGLECRFGVHPKSYWPWNPSRHIW